MIRTNIFSSVWRIACILFLALVCCVQVYQPAHLHHFHIKDSVAFEVSYHPLTPDVAHTSAHHHEENSSHEEDKEHKYNKNTDWNVARSKSLTNVTFDAPGLSLPAYSLPPVAFEKFRPFLQALSSKKERYVSFRIIRGPPQLV